MRVRVRAWQDPRGALCWGAKGSYWACRFQGPGCRGGRSGAGICEGVARWWITAQAGFFWWSVATSMAPEEARLRSHPPSFLTLLLPYPAFKPPSYPCTHTTLRPHQWFGHHRRHCVRGPPAPVRGRPPPLRHPGQPREPDSSQPGPWGCAASTGQGQGRARGAWVRGCLVAEGRLTA